VFEATATVKEVQAMLTKIEPSACIKCYIFFDAASLI